ncbi:hypothetical protein OC846_003662 [Tilletia horrida]|uniref:Zn(2)-C6 fungal-type domain-containing protein n=1 Tax=Tilletia horrida TaxID=155126 RepID=A0AAN6GPS8_9BASI|nr:hypothetical protein OC845_006316 [Tilletia horrida]KAK0550464.1 hypothetical protein OC846_003662 [Tilletia horrida]
MASGWGPPPSLKRSGVFYSGHPNTLPLSPNTTSPAASSSSAATPMPAPPPPPPPQAMGISANDEGEYDDDDDDDEDDEDNFEDEEDHTQSFASTSQHGRTTNAAVTDSQKRKRKLESSADDSLLSNTSQAQAGPSTSSNPAASGSGDDPPEKKPKVSRISKACTNCRRLKMRCVPSDKPGGHPCTRCLNSGGECLFSVSQRGKRTGKVKRNEAMVVSLKLKKMEETLNSVLRSIHDPTGSGGGALDAIASLPMSTFDSYSRTAADLPRSPFSNISSALPRVTASGSSSSAMAAQPPVALGAARANLPAPELSAASPGGQHINPGALTSSASYIYSQQQQPQNHSSSRSSHGGSQGAAFSPEHERGPLHGSASRSGGAGGGGGGIGGDASSASGSSHSHPSHLSHSQHRVPTKTSPRLHSLPDNALNPLGLLAEASLHNTERASRKAAAAIYHRRGNSFGSSSKEGESSMSSAGPAAGRPAEGGGEEGQEHSASAGDAGESPVASKTAGEAGAAKGGAGSSKTRVSVANVLGEEANEYRETSDAQEAAEAGQGGDDGTKTPRFVRPEGDFTKARGVASSTYFKPGPFNNLPLRRIIIEREVPPELLTKGIVSSEEVLDLFRIFFHNCSTHVVLLDPDMHTPAFICARSPFLFSVVCCVASRYYTHKRPDLYGKCLAEAKRCAFNIMHRGYKSVEIVQGFLLLAMWNQPSERYETDQTWLFSGVAMRMATDLNLHRKSVFQLPPDVSPDDPAVLEREREILNRERTWFICFTIDRGLAAQMGKPYTIREDFLTRNCRYWCEQRVSRPWDMALSGLVELLRLTSRMLDMLYSSTRSVNGLNLELDYSTMLRIWNEQLEEFRDQWQFRGVFPNGGQLPEDPFQDFKLRMAAHRAQRESAAAAAASSASAQKRNTDSTEGGAAAAAGESSKDAEANDLQSYEAPAADGGTKGETSSNITTGMTHDERVLFFLTQQAPLRWFYVVLLINSFGLQRAVETQSDDKGYFFIKCLSSAKGMLKAAQTGLRPVLRYAPDAQFVMISYAAVFLLKLLRQFPDWVDEDDVLGRISNVIVLLDEVAVNETHTPANYATFLRRLLNARAETRPGSPYASAFPSRAHTPARPLSAHLNPTGGASLGQQGEAKGVGAHPATSHLDGLAGLSAATLTSAAAGSSSHTFPASLPGATGRNSSNTNAVGSSVPPGLVGGLGGASSSSSSAPLGASTTLGSASNGAGLVGGPRRLSNFSPNIVSSLSQFGDETGGGGGTYTNAAGMMGGSATADGFGTEASATNNSFAFLLGGGNGNSAFGNNLGGGGGFGSNGFDGTTFFFQGDGGSSGNMGNGATAMDEGMSAAAFGVSSLAQLFPSNLGFVGTAAPADSSHSAAFGLSGSSASTNQATAGTNNVGAGVAGASNAASAQQTQVGQNSTSSIPVTGAAATAATNPTTQFASQHQNNNNNHNGGGHHHHHNQFGGEGSLFDDNFWSTLLPPGFGGSSQSLLGPSWDFSSGANFTSAVAGTQVGGGGGVSASPNQWAAGAAGGSGAGSSRGGTGTGGANMTPSMSGNGGGGAEGGGGGGAVLGRSARNGGTAAAGASNNASGGGAGANRAARGSTPSAVGAFNF